MKCTHVGCNYEWVTPDDAVVFNLPHTVDGKISCHCAFHYRQNKEMWDWEISIERSVSSFEDLQLHLLKLQL